MSEHKRVIPYWAIPFIVGIGGSATNDAGAGMAQARGARLLDAGGADKIKVGIVYQQDDYGQDGLDGWKKAAATRVTVRCLSLMFIGGVGWWSGF